jgi:rhodanese-related sulfurtransferase
VFRLVNFFADPLNLLLVCAALVSGGMLFWPVLRARAGGPTLGTLAATQLLNSRDVQIVDVRPTAQFGTGALRGSRNLPLAEVRARVGELDKSKPVLVVCEMGRSASLAAVKFRSAGVSEVYILGGGLNAWRAAGLPVGR